MKLDEMNLEELQEYARVREIPLPSVVFSREHLLNIITESVRKVERTKKREVKRGNDQKTGR